MINKFKLICLNCGEELIIDEKLIKKGKNVHSLMHTNITGGVTCNEEYNITCTKCGNTIDTY